MKTTLVATVTLPKNGDMGTLMNVLKNECGLSAAMAGNVILALEQDPETATCAMDPFGNWFTVKREHGRNVVRIFREGEAA